MKGKHIKQLPKYLALIAIIFITACTAMKQSRLQTDGSGPTGPSELHSFPSWLKGTWTGVGYQLNNNDTWSIRLIARGEEAEISYPSLKCGGTWKLLKIENNAAHFLEAIERGKSRCLDMGTIIITPVKPGYVSFSYFTPQGRFLASSTLVRQR